jgi:hypothetical protein
MNKQKNVIGYLLILAAISFWISWFLMPGAETTDTNHMLAIVKHSRMAVLCSVIVQIVSAVLYIVALFLLAQYTFPGKKGTGTGIILLGIGAMGICADAFFHLLAWFMTDDSVNIQTDIVRVMSFVQTRGVAFLIPLLLSFFIGSLVLANGLEKQLLISKRSGYLFITALLFGLFGAGLVKKILGYEIPGLALTVLALFVTGKLLMGFELIKPSKRSRYTLLTFAQC